jgi:hypothetical protein
LINPEKRIRAARRAPARPAATRIVVFRVSRRASVRAPSRALRVAAARASPLSVTAEVRRNSTFPPGILPANSGWATAWRQESSLATRRSSLEASTVSEPVRSEARPADSAKLAAA